ncbi:hypothetical protein RIF29_04436 [Crotalaria pallida]|uniref:Uncharacterized protein n=1 Tax=Crotalaria pallida TaxID=3830 RepID=A0AAN9P982_CROPI
MVLHRKRDGIVCRALPTPSQRPGFEPWCNSSQQQQHYFRDQSYARPLSFADILNETQVLHPAEGSSFSNFLFSTEHQEFLPNHTTATIMDKLIELPQLDSSTASLSATSLAIKKCNQLQHHNNGLIANEEYCNGERCNNNNISGQGAVGIDWKSLDNLSVSPFLLNLYYLCYLVKVVDGARIHNGFAAFLMSGSKNVYETHMHHFN